MTNKLDYSNQIFHMGRGRLPSCALGKAGTHAICLRYIYNTQLPRAHARACPGRSRTYCGSGQAASDRKQEET